MNPYSILLNALESLAVEFPNPDVDSFYRELERVVSDNLPVPDHEIFEDILKGKAKGKARPIPPKTLELLTKLARRRLSEQVPERAQEPEMDQETMKESSRDQDQESGGDQESTRDQETPKESGDQETPKESRDQETPKESRDQETPKESRDEETPKESRDQDEEAEYLPIASSSSSASKFKPDTKRKRKRNPNKTKSPPPPSKRKAEDVEESGLVLKVNPFVFQDSESKRWKVSLLEEVSTATLYDAPLSESFESKDKAIEALDHFEEQAKKEPDFWLERALHTWKLLNARQACELIQGTEPLVIGDAKYLIVYMAFGEPQLSGLPKYQEFQQFQEDDDVSQVIQALESDITQMMMTIGISTLDKLPNQDLVSRIQIKFLDFIPCLEAWGDEPVVGISFFVLQMPENTTLEQLESFDQEIFESLP